MLVILVANGRCHYGLDDLECQNARGAGRGSIDRRIYLILGRDLVLFSFAVRQSRRSTALSSVLGNWMVYMRIFSTPAQLPGELG